jgi:hypothetical protein
MDKLDKMLLKNMVRNYSIHDVLDVLQESIENRADELVDLNRGNSDSTAKEMSRVAYHLSIFTRG